MIKDIIQKQTVRGHHAKK